MSDQTFTQSLAQELEMEAVASRKCIERFPENLYNWKPHEKSMEMGYLALLVAQIPLWIATMIEQDELDFSTFERFEGKTGAELAGHFDENIKKALAALANISDEKLAEKFDLKNKGQVVYSASRKEMIQPCVNHLVHHRGQLTVYLRLNNIAVPPIYGPSADERGF